MRLPTGVIHSKVSKYYQYFHVPNNCFLTLSMGRYLCWWTISPKWYHPSSGRCLWTDMVY